LDRVVLKNLLNKDTSKSTFIIDPFDVDEISIILKNATPQIRNLFQFAFFSGMRTSELIALKWSDIDWGKEVIHVSRAVVEKQTKSTKTNAGIRDVVLLPPAREALQAQKSHTFLAGGPIFNNPRTDEPWETDAQIRKTAWVYVLKKSGVRYRNPYQTRHTYASMLLSEGENPWWVAEQMGHKTIEMIMRHYGKWIPDKSKKNGYQSVIDWEKKWSKTAP
jgi:integrase